MISTELLILDRSWQIIQQVILYSQSTLNYFFFNVGPSYSFTHIG
jgi:hypothetical protein